MSPIAANNLAWVYAQQGDNLDMALSLATQAKQIAPDMNAVNDTLAWIQYKKGNYKVSVSFAEDAVRRSPDNPNFRYHLGMALSGAGDKDRAHRTAEGALSEPEGDGCAGCAEDPGLAQVRQRRINTANPSGLTTVGPLFIADEMLRMGSRCPLGRCGNRVHLVVSGYPIS